MNNGKYIKIDRVLEMVYRDYGFENLSWQDAIEWIGECLDLIGAPMTYIEKATDGNEDLGHPEHITIVENRGNLPCDMHRLIQAFRCTDGKWEAMRVNTDSTHIAYFCTQSEDATRNTDLTYKLNNNHIFTSFETGKVALIYMANPTDERGYPMIPDNIKFLKACAAYVADKMLWKKEVQGNPVSPKVTNKIEQDLAWYIGAADSSARIPTIDEMESWKNNWIRLIPNINSHASAFRADGFMERRFNNSTNEAKNNNRLL